MKDKGMKTLVVYDSVFGATAQAAMTVAAAFSAQSTQIVKANEAGPEHYKNIDLLIVGSPTRITVPTRAMNKFIKSIPANALAGIKVACFDTRMQPREDKRSILNLSTRMLGYPADRIARRLVKKGGRLVYKTEGIYISDYEGPLLPGEIMRAGEWGKVVKSKS